MDWEKHTPPKGSKRSGSGRSVEEFLQDIFDKPHLLLLVMLSFVFLSGLFTSFYSVAPEERAVITRLGKYLTTNSEGLHFKIPFGIDKMTMVPTKKQQESFGLSISEGNISSGGSQGITPQTRNREQAGSSQFGANRQPSFSPFARTSTLSNSRTPEDESLMLTGDLNVARVEWVVQYQVKDPRQYLFNVADPVKNIRDLSQTTMRRVVGDLSINDILTVGRRDIELNVKSLMQRVIDEKYKMGVEILEVVLQNVAPPAPVQPSFNQVNSAIQEQKQEINRALESQNRVIGPAVGKANREISQSRGYAEAVINRAAGDASRFNSIYQEYAKAPEVTRRRLYLDLAEQIMRRVKNFTIVDPNLKGILPIYGGLGSASTESNIATSSQTKDARARISVESLAAAAENSINDNSKRGN